MLHTAIRALSSIAAVVLISADAFAYIDPGTGSMMIQWVLGAALAAFAAINVYWVRIRAFFSGSAQQKQADTEAEQSQHEANADQSNANQ
jgi:hypothetical protein